MEHMKSIRRYFEGLGIWVAIMPFLHFPVNVRNGLYIVTGITIFVSAYLYLRKRIAVAKDRVEPTFVESARTEKIETVSHTSAPHISGIEDIK
jgi:fibronectin type 3 domain-containing protein